MVPTPRPPFWVLCFFGIGGALGCWGTAAADWQIRGGLALEQLGYQEHLDPTGADSVLAVCDINGEPGTCFIDSDATLSNLRVDLGIQGNLPNGLMVGALLRTTASGGDADEVWRATANLGGRRGAGARFQTDALEYSWLRFDAYGGYRFVEALGVFGGVRISRAEQLRTRFRDGQGAPNPALDSATEPIDSTWFTFGALGDHWGPVHLDYKVEFGVPLSVKTTNTAIPGAEFSGVGGRWWEVGGHAGLPLTATLELRGGVAYGEMHWRGSDLGTTGNVTAKWPENDTQVWSIDFGLGIQL